MIIYESDYVDDIKRDISVCVCACVEGGWGFNLAVFDVSTLPQIITFPTAESWSDLPKQEAPVPAAAALPAFDRMIAAELLSMRRREQS